MPPQTLVISDALFARAQSHAVPLVDTIESVISRAFDALEGNGASHEIEKQDGSIQPYDPANPPVLTHSQPIFMKIDGEEVPRAELYWNHLMLKMVRRAVEAGYKNEDLHRLMVIPSVVGTKIDQGYVVYPDTGLSIQGQDSIGAWKQSFHLATKLGVKLEIVFKWQNHPKAVHPGKQGSFTVG